jgi:hypothetical protein
VVDPTRNRPELVRRQLSGVRTDQAAIDHDLSYNALATHGIDLRRSR